MTFKAHKEIEAENKPHMIELVKEIHEKVGVKFAETYVPPTNGAIDYPEEDINPDDVPFSTCAATNRSCDSEPRGRELSRK